MPSTPAPWTTEFTANTTNSGSGGNDQTNAQIVQLGNGNFVVIWTDNSDGGVGSANSLDMLGQLYSADGTALGSEFLVNQNFAFDSESNACVAALGTDDFIVIFEDTDVNGTSIRAQKFLTNGSNVTANSSITIQSDTNADLHSAPRVLSNANGSYVVVYETFDSAGGGTTTFNAVAVSSGNIAGAPTALANFAGMTPHGNHETATLSDGNHALVYQSSTGDDAIVVQCFDGSGTAVGGSITVAATAANDEVDANPSIIGLSGGGFVVAWSHTDVSDTDVLMQRYDNAGAAQGGVINVGSGAADNNTDASLVTLTDGGFVVTCVDGAAGTLASQRYDASGAAVGSPVIISNGTESSPFGTGLGDGRFILGYTSDNGGDSDIRLQILDSRDGPNTTGQDLVGTAGNDTLIHNANSQNLFGADGDDTLFVDFDFGMSTFSGGAGSDTIAVDIADTVDYIFNLSNENVQHTGNAQFRNYDGIENAAGGAGDDQFIGRSGQADIMTGNGGVDTFSVGTGGDQLFGGAGNDIFSMSGPRTHDAVRIDGGDGMDTLLINSQSGTNDFSGAGAVFSSIEAVDFGNIATIQISYLRLSAEQVNNSAQLAQNLIIRGNQNQASTEVVRIDMDSQTFLSVADWTFNANWTDETDYVQVNGDADDENIIGSSNADRLFGGGGNDTLSGGGGSDQLFGGDGNDTLYAGSGGASPNILQGGAGNDVHVGSFSVDQMSGGSGDDTYIISTVGNVDTVTEFSGEGQDTVYVRGNYTMGDHIETAVAFLGGLGRINLTGNGGDNVIIATRGDVDADIDGGAGNDTIYGLANENILGGTGNDTIAVAGNNNTAAGGTGDDTYILSNAAADIVVTENDGEGNDILYSYRINTTTLAGNVESLVLINANPGFTQNATGNAINNTLIGNAESNTLSGLDGNDFMICGAGDDTLIGGAGLDVMQGNTGNDNFFYNSAAEAGDIIQDWVAADDSFVFGATSFGMTAGQSLTAGLNLISDINPFSVAAQATFLWDSDDTALYFDADGTGAGAAILVADLQAFTDVSVADFVFI